MKAGLALTVLVLNVIALLSILGSRAAAGRKIAWTAAVVLLPLLGALGWLTTGRGRPAGSHRTGHRGTQGRRTGRGAGR